MKSHGLILCISFASVICCSQVATTNARQEKTQIPASKISELDAKLEESKKARSTARKKLALKRVLRSAESLLEANQTASNRFQVLHVVFRGQQALLGVDDSSSNRKAFLKTCHQLAMAPQEYAALRLDADLLLSQADLAKKGADSLERAAALRPLVERYKDTDVEAKVLRIAMLMALEFGDARLIGHLKQVIAERFAGDPEMINFQRDKLAGQVFGAPFIGRFELSDGKILQCPLDILGATTAFYFWSTKDEGMADIEELAAAWKKVKPEDAARLKFVSCNLDDLPDGGESILRKLGLDWPAIKLPGGQKHPIYKTYVRRHPGVNIVSPTGYAAIFLSGGRRSRGYERNLQSMMARVWTQPRYTSQLQSVIAGEHLVLDPAGEFDPARPLEWKAIAESEKKKALPLERTVESVPVDKLKSIQDCFLQTPFRYRTPVGEVRALYKKIDNLCRDTIAQHPQSSDLWIVQNRRIVALLGLWRIDRNQSDLDAAVAEARALLDQGCPAGTDLLARYCLAHQKLRVENTMPGDGEPKKLISEFVQEFGNEPPPLVFSAAAILSLGAGDRILHERYRKRFLENNHDNPSNWLATSFFLNRYHRYWLYHPPFVAGWTYGRRQGHFLATGKPEDAKRMLKAELKTIEGKPFRIPEDTFGKWTVISFAAQADAHRLLLGTKKFAENRPFKDVNLFAAYLDDDAERIKSAMVEKKIENEFSKLLVPGGMKNPIAQKLGILAEDERNNVLVLRPDGSIAVSMSGLTMKHQKDNVIKNVIEWHDEKAVDKAIADGNLDEAKRLAFGLAPKPASTDADSNKKSKPVPISVPHLRSRAKVYMAMKDWNSAYDDIQKTYLQVNSKAGWLSMRTQELEETEKLKAEVLRQLEKANSN